MDSGNIPLFIGIAVGFTASAFLVLFGATIWFATPPQDPRPEFRKPGEKLNFIGAWRWWLAFHRERNAHLRDLEWEQRENEQRIAASMLAEQQAIEATKPKAPPEKSKRLTASGRSSRQFNRRFGPALSVLMLCAIFLSMAGPQIFITWTPILVIATLIGTGIWNSQDWVQDSWRDQEREEMATWDKEDAEWMAHENALKTWEEGRQRIQEMTPRPSSQHPADITLEARAAADALRRST